MTKSIFRIRGMDCAEEVRALKQELDGREGIEELAFDVLNARMTVTHDAAVIGESQIQAAVARTGMQAERWSEVPPGHHGFSWRAALTSASGVLLAAGFAVHASTSGFAAALGADEGAAIPVPAIILYCLAIISGAWFVAPKAVLAIRRLRADMNLLMMLAVAGAMLLGEWFEAASVAFLFSLSLALESWSVRRARHAVTALMSVAPNQARIFCPHDKQHEMVDVERVAVGSRVFVRPGEKFPLDGIIREGESDINEAPITGESVPVTKSAGDEVFAGSINGSGAVEVETTRVAGDTALARIVRLVTEAQSRRSPSEQWVEKFSRYYTPTVIVLAVGAALVPPLLFNQSFSSWFYQALVLLVIACPCALVISTPVSIVAALASSARHGVLVKGGGALEAAGRLRAIAFDKTGTLTVGQPRVRELIPMAGISEEELLAVAASIEAHSEHPIGGAIVRAARERHLAFEAARDYQALGGRGATAQLDGEAYWIGSRRLLSERGFENEELRAKLEELASAGTSIVAVGNEERVLGVITLADAMHSETKEAIGGLRELGLRAIMLTGDNRATAEAIARESGIDVVRAELLPEDKLMTMEGLLAEYGEVGMVGDGINDAPALARSSLGIAMGHTGTDVALETADVALMKDNLLKISWLVGHSRRTLGVIRQNVVLSIAIKILFMVLAFAGAASLWSAIAADMGVSLLVIFNALRLLKS